MASPEAMLISRLQQAQQLCSQRLEHTESAELRHEIGQVIAVMRDAQQVLTTWAERIASRFPAQGGSASTPQGSLSSSTSVESLPSRHFLNEMTALVAEIFERHGITEDEMDVLWNYYAALAFEMVWNQEGVFYEQVKKLFAPPP